MMEISILISALLLGAKGVSAQSSAVLWLPYFEDTDGIVGSILASDSTATTFTFACATTIDLDDCTVPTPFVYTAGPSTLAFTQIYDPYYDGDYMTTDSASLETYLQTCQITASYTGVCITSEYGPGNNAVATTTLTGFEELGLTQVALTTNLAALQSAAQTTDDYDPYSTQVTKTVVSYSPVGTGSTSETKSSSTGTGSTSETKSSSTGTGSATKSSSSSTGSASGNGVTTTVTAVVTPSSSTRKSQNGATIVTRGPWIGAAAVGMAALAAL